MDVLTEICSCTPRVIDIELDVDTEWVVWVGRWWWISLDHWLLDKYYSEDKGINAWLSAATFGKIASRERRFLTFWRFQASACWPFFITIICWIWRLRGVGSVLLRGASSAGKRGLLSISGRGCLGLRRAFSSRIGIRRFLIPLFRFTCTFTPDLGRDL